MTPTTAFESYCDAFARGDYLTIADLFTDDGVFEASNLDKPIRGRNALEAQLRVISNACRHISTEIKTSFETDSVGHFEGAYKAEIIGTGSKIDGAPYRVDFKFVAVLELRNGKIARLTEIFDTAPLYPEERQRMWAINRRTPYWARTESAKCTEWSVYNNMHFPMLYSRTPYEDYCALIEDVTLWDVGLERQTQLSGPHAQAFLDYLCCRDMSTMQVGDCRYGLVCDEYGQMMCDPVVLYPWENTIWMSHGSADLTFWARGIVMGSNWQVEVTEPDVAPFQLQGPRALDTLSKVCDAELGEMKNYTCLTAEVAGHRAVVSRTGWSGGYGFEVYPLSSTYAVDIWDAVHEAGDEFSIKITGPIVSRAVERGVTDINYYMNSDMNALEDMGAKLVDIQTQADFIGKGALQAIAAAGVKRHSVGLLFDSDVARLEWFWPLCDEAGRTGEVRWAVYSFALDQFIGIAVVDIEIEVGDVVEVTHPHGMTRATVTTVPFVGRGQ